MLSGSGMASVMQELPGKFSGADVDAAAGMWICGLFLSCSGASWLVNFGD